MKTDFTSDFADFLEERLGKALFALRESNEEYRSLSDEYENLLNSRYESATDYQKGMEKISDASRKLGDIEKRYLFLAGMREHMRMDDALLSKDFENLFTEEK